MRVLLISANAEQVNMPTIPLGPMLVAASTRSLGHEVQFLDLMFKENAEVVLQNRIKDLNPEVIGISVRNIDDQTFENPEFFLENVRSVIDWCKAASSAPVILGGAGYSIFPDAVLEYLNADMGVQGEGERIFPAILERLDRGEDPSTLPGVHIPGRKGCPGQEFYEDLDSFPLPDDETWSDFDPKSEDTWIPVETRRGCPNYCSYCSTVRIQGSRVRTRSPLLVAQCMERLSRLGFKNFYVVDNSFNIPESQGLDFCDQLASLHLDIQWKAILYPHGVTPKLVKSMKRAGCVEVAVGFESGCTRILKGMNKHFEPDEVRRVCRILADNEIRRIGFLLFGAPGETRESVLQSLDFADSLNLEGLRTTVGIRIYPGTELEKRALSEGIIHSKDELLFPRFYLAKEVDPWIRNTVETGFRLKKV